MSPRSPLHVAVAAACALGFAPFIHAQDFGDIALSLAQPDVAAPAAPAKVAQAAPSSGAGAPTSRSADAAPNRGGDNATARLASSDRKFIEKAAKGGMAEVALGKLAQQRGMSAEVKQFGSRMVEDHGKANEELKRLASSKGVELPSDMDRSEERTLKKLERLDGADFDRAYMKEMRSDHKKDVSEFRSKARSSRDGDVKSFAENTLPTLEQHLERAEAVEQALRGAAPRRAGATMRAPASAPSSTSGTTGA